ncbi:uncharacterized protein RCC_04239 [Ramularia collo-cygni]|uniref:Presequence translocated-associated motor subunit PAM17 n=1 Tax=Ramularia collo-cygni TaxID=112498 RepID=A0A2D3UW09_9PEZI|nr:uncharacterized protein RCC_04239 [Ramularia collo-cygni]CZT18395.1 uncharacterized protein RCC_04239 [Ramularia collo-cygni]
MAALFCPRPATACLRSFPRAASPVIASVSFSRQITRSSRLEEKSRGIANLALRENIWTSKQGGSSTVRQHRSMQIRHASTVETTTPTPPTPNQTPSAADELLTWDRFFKLRRTRRWINAGCSIVTAVASVGIFAPVLAQQDFDVWGAQISGLDPVIVIGISTFGIAALGWLMGPTVGNGGFRIWAGRRGWTKEIASKEKSFYARIKKYRADASSSSPQNPIPDYYGEKVASVKDYRRWLKDQRAFNLKKNKNMI